MKYFFRFLPLCCLSFFFMPLQAQESSSSPAPLELTLEECIAYAIEHNISVRQSRLDLLSDEASLSQSKAELLPSLNASTNASYSVGRTINQFSNEYVDQPVRQQNVGISADVVLFNSFRRLKTIRQNRNNITVSQLNVEATENDVTLQVVSAYTQVLFNRELLGATRNQLRTSELQLNRTRRLVAAGSLPSADAMQQEAQVASNEVAVANAENDLALAYLQLKQLLQIPYEQPLEIVVPEVEVPSEEAIPSSANAVYQVAVTRLPAIQSADLQIVSAQYGIAIARTGYFPTLSASAGLGSQYSSIAPSRIPAAGADNIEQVLPTGDFLMAPEGIPGIPQGTRIPVLTETDIPASFTDNTYLNQLDFNLRRFIGIGLNIPVFNNWQVRSNVANARIALERARLQSTDRRMQLRQTIEQAYLDARAAAKSYAASQRQVNALQAAFRNTEVRYETGSIDAVLYNQTKNELNSAESDLIRAKYNYIFSLKVLDFYQGQPLEF